MKRSLPIGGYDLYTFFVASYFFMLFQVQKL